MRVQVRFYAELNDHLPPEMRFRTLEREFLVPGTVKDLIESFGVPHTEVELIMVSGDSVGFDYTVRDGDRIAVYPVFEALDVTSELRVRREPLRETKFVLDIHLGRLAAYLRMLGFDTLHGCVDDSELARISQEQRRILLTRDRGLLMHGRVTHGYWLRETQSRAQLSEVLARFDLARRVRPFTRCMACNGMLVEVPSDPVKGDLRQCPDCRRLYWKGSHYRRMQEWITRLV